MDMAAVLCLNTSFAALQETKAHFRHRIKWFITGAGPLRLYAASNKLFAMAAQDESLRLFPKLSSPRILCER